MERVRERPPERIEPTPPAEEPAVVRGRPQARPRPEEPVVENRVQENIFLQPIAAPSILGLYGFCGATFVVAAGLLGLYAARWDVYTFQWAAFFGGLAQFLAAMWAYKARDGLATAIHGMWGSFWMAYGFLWLLIATGVLAFPFPTFVGLGWWFVPLGFITLSGAVGATQVSWALFAVLSLLGAGSGAAAAGFISGSTVLIAAAGGLFFFSAIAAWWTASGLMFERLFGRTLLPLGPRKMRPTVTLPTTEPGVIRGQ